MARRAGAGGPAGRAAGAGTRAARRGLVLATGIAVPVVVDPTRTWTSDIPKLWVLFAAAATLVVLWAAARRPPRLPGGLGAAVVAMVAWAAVTTAASTRPRISLLGAMASYDGLVTRVCLALLLVAAAEAVTGGDLRGVVTALYLGAGGLVVAYGLVQLHDLVLPGAPRWDPVPPPAPGAPLRSTLGNPNHLGGFLSMLLPLGVALLALERRRWARVLVAAVGVGAVVELAETTARGAWLALAAALAVVGWLLRGEPARRRVARPLLGLLAVGVAAALALGAAGLTKGPLATLGATGEGTTVALRLELWQAALQITGDRPLLGIGPDTFAYVFPRYQSDAFVRQFGLLQFANGPHNTFLNTLVGQGVPGLALLGWLLGAAAARAAGAWRRLRAAEHAAAPDQARRARELRVLLAGVAAAAVAYLVQASFNVQFVALSVWFWLLLGLISAAHTAACGLPDRGGR